MAKTGYINISINTYPDDIDLNIETKGKLSDIVPAMVVMNIEFIKGLPEDAQARYIKILLKAILDREFGKESRGA